MSRGGKSAPAALRLDEDIAMKARVTVTLKNGVLDPQGKAIEGALKSLGVAGVASVRQGKVFDIELEEGDRKSTRLNSSHDQISYAVFCLKKKKTHEHTSRCRRNIA